MNELTAQNVAEDAELVARALTGGAECFGAIVRRYKDAVFGVALSRVHNFHDAEDLTQGVFLEAFDGLQRLREPARLGPWLRMIAIHHSINHVKRRVEAVDLDAVVEPRYMGPSAEEQMEGLELRQRVLDAIGGLRKTHRETVMLFYIGDHSLAEVANLQEVPVGTVKRRLHDARVLLKEEMLEMVEEVLHDSVPDEAFADRVFAAIAALPPGRALDRHATSQVVARFGRAGREGFRRAYDLPHAYSRLRAVQFVSPYHGKPLDNGPPQAFTLDVLLEALTDPNRRVRQAAAARLVFLHTQMGESAWIRDVLPHLLALMTHESKHTRRMAIGKIDIWVRWGHVPKQDVRDAQLLEPICRALAQERDPEVLRRFQGLIAHVLEVGHQD